MIRRTENDKKEILRLKSLVIEKINKHSISAYEIGENVKNVTFPTVLHIQSGKTQYPNIDKLKNILNYIETQYEGKETSKRKEVEITEVTISQLYDIIQKLENKLDLQQKMILEQVQENGIRQQLLFELLTNAKAEEVKFLQEKISEKSEKQH